MARKRAHGEGTISKRKDGRWEAKASVGYKPDGKPDRKTVYGRTQAEVKEKLEAIKRQLATGTYTTTKLTIAAYLEHWLSEKQRSVKPTTAENYAICVNRFIVPRIGRVGLDKLTPMQTQTLLNEIQDASGAARAAKCRSVLNNAYRQAVRWQLVVRNPVEATDPVKEQPRDMTLWEAPEAARFLDAAREHRLYALFYLGMATGLRRGELLGLRWVDIEGNLLYVKQTYVKAGGKLLLSTPKTEKGFWAVALSPDVLEVLLLHRQRQEAERSVLGEAWTHPELVFASEVGTPLNPDNLSRLRKKLMMAAQVSQARLHDLRHLHASVAIESGMDAKVLADRLGHSRASFTLDRYTHLFESRRAKSAVSLTAWLTPDRGEPN
jgi:integrase